MECAKTIQVAGVVDDSIVDGEGYRMTVFVQGCPRRCPSCQNPDTQPFEGGTEMTADELVARFKKNPLLSGVTLSGGEPFAQAAALVPIAKGVHNLHKTVWSYSGYTLEELENLADEGVSALLAEIDVLVDGDYREEERDLTLKFRGSRNQRVIDMKKTRESGNMTLYNFDNI